MYIQYQCISLRMMKKSVVCLVNVLFCVIYCTNSKETHLSCVCFQHENTTKPEMLKSFWTCQSFWLILIILSVRTIKYAAEIWIFHQSKWNFVSQILRSGTFRHHCQTVYLIWYLHVESKHRTYASLCYLYNIDIFQFVTQNRTFTRQITLCLIIFVILTIYTLFIHYYWKYMYVIRSFKYSAFNKPG